MAIITISDNENNTFTIDLKNGNLSSPQRPSKHLTPNECKLICYLLEKDNYTDTVCNITDYLEMDNNSLNQLVHHLRKKICNEIIDTSIRNKRKFLSSNLKIKEDTDTSSSSQANVVPPSKSKSNLDSSYTGDYYIYYLSDRSSEDSQIAVGMMRLNYSQKIVTCILPDSENPDSDTLKSLLDNPRKLNELVAESLEDFYRFRAFEGTLQEEFSSFSCTLSEIQKQDYRKFIVFRKRVMVHQHHLTSAIIAVLTTSHNADAPSSLTYWIAMRDQLDLSNKEIRDVLFKYLNSVPIELRSNLLEKDSVLFEDYCKLKKKEKKSSCHSF